MHFNNGRLSALWADPGLARSLSPDAWTETLRAARGERLLARLGWRIEDRGHWDDCPEAVREMLIGARAYPQAVHTQVMRELRHLRHALAGLAVEPILLKGGAYLAASLPMARGRDLKDLDVLIPRSVIGAVEKRLLDAGWVSQVQDAYDQRYYRDWMHEIPPLRHPERYLELDLHHTILPLTSRLRPDPDLFRKTSLPLAAFPGTRILAAPDMVLHTATHLFYDGEIRGGLQDLWDIDDQLRHFAARDGAAFWMALLARAEALGLGRPLYYGLTFAARLLSTPIPEHVERRVRARFGPNLIADRLMGRLVARVLAPAPPGTTPLSDWLLYARSHWLRMPPRLLLPHLARKTWRRIRPGKERQTVTETAG